jgi:hypothetical protein
VETVPAQRRRLLNTPDDGKRAPTAQPASTNHRPERALTFHGFSSVCRRSLLQRARRRRRIQSVDPGFVCVTCGASDSQSAFRSAIILKRFANSTLAVKSAQRAPDLQ